MIVSEFVKEYNAAANKEKYVEKHIVMKYLPYARKAVICTEIINRSMYKDVNGERMFCPDSPLRYLLFVLALVESYTDIKLPRGDNGALDGFDSLEKSGATEVLVKAIGSDVNRLNTVLKMMVDDATDMERALVPFLETKARAWQIAMEAMGRAVAEKAAENGV